MGNSSVGATIVVVIQNPQGLYGGATIFGTVYLQVDKDKVSADSLNVKFNGVEKTCVTYQETVGSGENQRTETRYDHASRVIASVDKVITMFHGSVNKGRYEFPFQLVLPTGLPPSFSLTYGSEHHYIDYGFEVRLHRNGILNWDVHQSQKIVILEPPIQFPRFPTMITPMDVPIYFCCCYKTGNMQMIGNLTSTHANIGEQVEAQFGVVNHSSSFLKGVEMYLTRIHHFRGTHHHAVQSTTIIHERINNSSLAADSALGKHNERKIYPAINEEMLSNMHTRMIALPDIPPTYNGIYGSIQYRVSFRAATKFCVSDPQLDIPFVVHKSSPILHQPVMVIAQPVEHGQVMQQPQYQQYQPLPTHDQQQQQQQQQYPQFQPPQQLPSDWNTTSLKAEVVNLGSIEVEMPALPPNVNIASVDYLLYLLDATDDFAEVSMLQRWLQHGNVSELTNKLNFGRVFGKIHGVNSFAIYPDIIGERISEHVTTKLITEAAAKVPAEHRATICCAFAKFCVDKPNAKTDFPSIGLTPFALATVMSYYT